MPAAKRTIIVHAGRHKTGTSAIQHFLFANRDALAAAGFYYPTAGFLKGEPAHHALALSLNPHNRSFNPEVAHRVQRNFAREIQHNEGTVVVSSEQFQNIPPSRLAKYLPNWDVRVIIYLRDHLHYLVSSYQQIVHARTVSMSMDEYRERLFRVVYADMLDAWADCFGKSNLQVCIYDKALFRNGNVVEDVIWRITGREAGTFGSVSERDINPSLGEPLLEFKRRINAHLPNEAEQLKILYGAFSRLAARNAEWRKKPQVTPEFVDRVKKFVEPDTERLVGRYLQSGPSPFSFGWPRIGPSMDWQCDGPAIMDLMRTVSPQAVTYIRSRVPIDILAPAAAA